jgi:hypothetical protein
MGAADQKTILNLLEKEFELGANADVEIHVGKRRFKVSLFLEAFLLIKEKRQVVGFKTKKFLNASCPTTILVLKYPTFFFSFLLKTLKIL